MASSLTMPKVSICIPTRNRAHNLAGALAQLADFRRLDFEVVVSDNCSDDDTADVVRSFRDRLPQLYYVRQPVALNFFQTQQPPFNLAVGDYLVYFADDDRLLEDGVAEVVAALDADPTLAVAYGIWQEVEGGVAGTRHHVVDAPVRFGLADLPEICLELPVLEMPFIRRTAYEAALAPMNYQYAFDLFGLSQLLKVGDMLMLPVLTHQVTKHEGQASASLYRDDLLHCCIADYELVAAASPALTPAEALTSISIKIGGQYMAAAQRALDDGRFLHARTLIQRAVAYDCPNAKAWREVLDIKLWPHMVAEAALAFARTAQPVERIVIEEAEGVQPIIDIMPALANGMEVMVGSADDLVQLPWSEDEFFLYANPDTLELRQAITGQPIRKRRGLAQLRQAVQLGQVGEQEPPRWQAASS